MKLPTSKEREVSVSLPPQLNTTSLLDYATYLLTNCTTPEQINSDPEFYQSPSLASSCVSPLPALRAWALLGLMGVDKTRKELYKNVAKIIGSKPDEIHEYLNSVDPRLLGVVHFFADNPKDAVLNEDVISEAEEHYKNKKISPIVNMCFACDPDGMRSIYLINKTVRESTNDRVQYVVREEHAPYRVSMTVLTSAIDCTFYWKPGTTTTHFLKTKRIFHGEDAEVRTAIEGWTAKGNFYSRSTDKGTVLRLDSHQPDLTLLLYIANGETPPTAAEILEAGQNITAPKGLIQIFVPEFFVSVPLGLRDCSRDGNFNMKRVFDREKADLSGHLKDFHGYNPTITMLWDHYHKAVFKLVAGTTESKLLSKEGGRKLSLRGRMRTEDPLKYYEDHLPHSTSFTEVTAEIEEATGDVIFDRPFYFMVVQDIHANALLQCYGRYSN